MNNTVDPETAYMTVQQFLLFMGFARIALMIVAIGWLLTTNADRRRITIVMLSVCMFMLCSNLINSTISVAVLKVTPW